jgi:cell division protein FtsW (lipid II flippase)
LLERVAATLGWAAVAALAATVGFGESVGSASRWLALGPLQIQTSALVLPVIVVAISILFARGSMLLAFAMAGAAELSLIAQPDGSTALVLAVAATAVAFAINRTGFTKLWVGGGTLTVAAISALPRDPDLPAALHTEGVMRIAAGAPLGVIALILLALVPIYPIARAFRIPAQDRTARGVAVGVGCSLAASFVLAISGSSPVPLVGYGGSSVVACMIALGFVLALDTDAIAARATLIPRM